MELCGPLRVPLPGAVFSTTSRRLAARRLAQDAERRGSAGGSARGGARGSGRGSAGAAAQGATHARLAGLAAAGLGVSALRASVAATQGLGQGRRRKAAGARRAATTARSADADELGAAPERRAGSVSMARRGALASGAAAAASASQPPRAALAFEREPPTIRTKVSDGVVTFDQAFGIPGLGIGANIPIRMTVLALDGGGYLVYNPCHPTSECIGLLEEAGLSDIRYFVLGTTAIEHKFYAPEWSDRYPKAQVWISPRTFSWPIDFGSYVPVVGFKPGTELRKIPKDPSAVPWASQGIEHLQLTVDYAPRTVFEETVMFHRASGTFVCTDMLVGFSHDPPEILKQSPYREGLLYFARDSATESIDVSSEATLREGYQKSTLLLNNINPRSLLSVAAGDLTVAEQLGLAFKAPQKQLGYNGWYPCNWQELDAACAKVQQRESNLPGSKGFECRPGWRGEWNRLAAGTVGNAGTGFQVPSFVAELQISRDPEAVLGFAAEIARRWPSIRQVVSSHFSCPLPANAAEVQQAIGQAAKGPPGPLERIADLSAILTFREYLEDKELIYKPARGRGAWRWNSDEA